MQKRTSLAGTTLGGATSGTGWRTSTSSGCAASIEEEMPFQSDGGREDQRGSQRDNLYPVGQTVHQARRRREVLLCASEAGMKPEDIAYGVNYPCRDLYDWHHRLTGSCEMGRQQFAKDHGIDIDRDEMTVQEFIDLTRDAYGGEVIRRMEKGYR